MDAKRGYVPEDDRFFSSDAIEKIGIERSYASLAKADVVIGVLDALSPLEESGKADCKSSKEANS